MNRELLLKLRQDNRTNLTLYNLLTTIIGECDRLGKDLSEDKIISIFKKIYKNNELTISLSKNKNVESIKFENEFLINYLPRQLSDKQLINEIELCFNNGFTTIGEIMKHFNLNFKGQFDGKSLMNLIKNKLN